MISYGSYPDLLGVGRVLVIKLRHHGDVLLSSPVFSSLRRALPGAVIDAYIYRDTLPMLEGHSAIDGYCLYDRGWKALSFPRRLTHELALLQQIRTAGYDLVINLTEGDRGAIAARASGARIRVGDRADGFKGRSYTHGVVRSRLPRHMVEQNLDALRRIGIFPAPDQRDLYFSVPDEATARVRTLLAEAGIQPGRYIHFHPTSRWLFKCWPEERVAQLASDLHARGHAIVVSAAPDTSELAMLQAIQHHCPGVPLLNLGGMLSLKELGALIADARCLVCVDSVPFHIASALKTPVVGLFGPSSDTVWGTWGNPNARIVAQPFSCRPCNLDGCGGGKVSDCLATLGVAQVMGAVEQVLESSHSDF